MKSRQLCDYIIILSTRDPDGDFYREEKKATESHKINIYSKIILTIILLLRG